MNNESVAEDSELTTLQMSNYLITGANSGIGWSACGQLALREDTTKVYLACRSSFKAQAAIQKLVSHWGCPQGKLEYIHFDASETKKEIESVTKSLDGILLNGLVLNAGGPGDDASEEPTRPNGVMDIVQINIIGHMQLVQALQCKRILTEGCRIIYSGSESARGIPMFFQPAPQLGDSVDFFERFMKGSGATKDISFMYAATKGFATLYFAAYARRNSSYKVLIVSPGGTFGTNALQRKSIPWYAKIIVKFMWLVAYYLGRFQILQQGAKKYVDAVTGGFDDYPSGTFLACSVDLAGPLCDQVTFPGGLQYSDVKKQEAAYDALKGYL
jgi:NAD(P)-dependent dehydrogenase (short-subunit alcohol dehydrogenase family)